MQPIRFETSYRLPELFDLKKLPECEKIFKEALYLSKGKTNNAVCALLAMLNIPAEDIVKYFKEGNVGVKKSSPFIQKDKNKRLTPSQREANRLAKRIPNYWDTYDGKKLKATLGTERILKFVSSYDKYWYESNPNFINNLLVSSIIFEEYRKYSIFMNNLTCSMFSNISYARYTSDSFKAMNQFANYIKQVDVIDYDFTSAIIRNSVRDEVELNSKSYPFFIEMFKHDINAMNNLSSDVIKDIRMNRHFAKLLYDNSASYRMLGGYKSNEANSIMYKYIIEAFYGVCKQLNIFGLITNAEGKVSYRREPKFSEIKRIMQKVIKSYSTYEKLVKQGFDTDVAKQTILDEINSYIELKMKDTGIVFYPYESKKVKSNA